MHSFCFRVKFSWSWHTLAFSEQEIVFSSESRRWENIYENPHRKQKVSLNLAQKKISRNNICFGKFQTSRMCEKKVQKPKREFSVASNCNSLVKASPASFFAMYPYCTPASSGIKIHPARKKRKRELNGFGVCMNFSLAPFV